VRESSSLAEQASVWLVSGLYILIDRGADAELQLESSSAAQASRLKTDMLGKAREIRRCRTDKYFRGKNPYLT
jgi:hypothetical protein